jgi:hypothetical protein
MSQPGLYGCGNVDTLLCRVSQPHHNVASSRRELGGARVLTVAMVATVAHQLGRLRSWPSQGCRAKFDHPGTAAGLTVLRSFAAETGATPS